MVLFSAGFALCVAASAQTPPPDHSALTHRIEVVDSSGTGRVYPWNIVSATTTPKSGPPQPGWRDFARVEEPSLERVAASSDRSTNSSPKGPLADADIRVNHEGKEVPAFWEAILPATYTVEFATPFRLHQVDLTPPLRKIGFSKFSILVRGATAEVYHPAVIIEGTTARGPTLEAGYLWSIRIEPTLIRGVRIDFEAGTIDFPDRVFLKDLDLWGE